LAKTAIVIRVANIEILIIVWLLNRE